MNRKILKRYPRLVAHLMCESLGYFSVGSAVMAIEQHKKKQGCWCEWYAHMAGNDWSEEKILEIGTRTLKAAFARRKSHRGYMAEFQVAWNQIQTELQKEGATAGMLAGWF